MDKTAQAAPDRLTDEEKAVVADFRRSVEWRKKYRQGNAAGRSERLLSIIDRLVARDVQLREQIAALRGPEPDDSGNDILNSEEHEQNGYNDAIDDVLRLLNGAR